MIVKAMTNENRSWRFFDNATAVQSGEVTRELAPPSDQIKSYPLNDGSLIVEESYVSQTLAEYDCITPGIGLVSFESHGRSYNIYTDYPVYLLNDSGKTIERLK